MLASAANFIKTATIKWALKYASLTTHSSIHLYNFIGFCPSIQAEILAHNTAIIQTAGAEVAQGTNDMKFTTRTKISQQRAQTGIHDNTGCFKKSFRMVFQMLLCIECYENVYT
jgi:hypothetical protein